LTHPWLSALLGQSLSALLSAEEGAFLVPNHLRGTAMTKRAQAKYKIDRRMGENIWGRPQPFNKRE
jgi:small subunit ribosomal protein S4